MAKKEVKQEEVKVGFTPKEKLAHYAAVANGSAPVKQSAKYGAREQRAYARGQADARRENNISFMLGKHSPLSADEKAELKAELKRKREEYKANKKNKRDNYNGEPENYRPTAEENAEYYKSLNEGKL